jgi:hypothetical protein
MNMSTKCKNNPYKFKVTKVTESKFRRFSYVLREILKFDAHVEVFLASVQNTILSFY